MLEHQAADGYSYISQSTLADYLNCSQGLISRTIRVLEKYQAIKRIKPGVYQVLNPSLDHTPIATFFKLLRLLEKDPSLGLDYKKQAQLLNVDLKEVQRAWGMITYVNKGLERSKEE